MMAFIMANVPALVSVVSLVLSIGVIVAQMAHKQSVADSLQKVEDVVKSIQPKA